MLDVRCWMFDVGCSMLDVRCWMFDVRCSMFDVRCSMFDVECSMFHVRCSMFDVGCWMFDVRCSMFPPRGLKVFTRPSTAHIQRTFHSNARLLHHMRINLRGAHILMPQQLLHRPNIITIFQQMRRPRKSLRSTRLTRLRVMDASSNNDAIDSSEIVCRRRSLNIVRVPAHPALPNKPHSRSTATVLDMTSQKPLPLGALSIAFANLSRSRYTIRHRHLNGEHKRRTCSNPNSETAWSEAIYAASPTPAPPSDTSVPATPAATPPEHPRAGPPHASSATARDAPPAAAPVTPATLLGYLRNRTPDSAVLCQLIRSVSLI